MLNGFIYIAAPRKRDQKQPNFALRISIRAHDKKKTKWQNLDPPRKTLPSYSSRTNLFNIQADIFFVARHWALFNLGFLALLSLWSSLYTIRQLNFDLVHFRPLKRSFLIQFHQSDKLSVNSVATVAWSEDKDTFTYNLTICPRERNARKAHVRRPSILGTFVTRTWMALVGMAVDDDESFSHCSSTFPKLPFRLWYLTSQGVEDDFVVYAVW